MATEVDTDGRDLEALAAQEEAERKARREEVAAMPLERLLRDATDAELSQEALRCSRWISGTRTPAAIGEEEALARLERGLERLPAYADAAVNAVRSEALRRPDGVSPQVLVSALLALEATRAPEALTDRLRKAVKADGNAIVEGNPRAEWRAKRQEVEARRDAISGELERRSLERRGIEFTRRAKR